jgi:hypothetical protein
MYLGHSAKDVTAGYETAELSAYLEQDRLALLAHLTATEQGLRRRRLTA